MVIYRTVNGGTIPYDWEEPKLAWHASKWIDIVQVGLGWAGMGWVELAWAGSDWFELGWPGLGWVGFRLACG